MQNNRILYSCAILSLGICGWSFAYGQAVESAPGKIAQVSVAAEDLPSVPSRVVERIDEARLVRLTGNTHPMARPKYDQGLVDPQLLLERMVLVLKRSPEQEAALEKLMEEQLDPKSSNFHHWLTPEEFGKAYGPSDSDLAATTSWLQNHGFQIYQVNKGRVTIEFSGTAEQVQNAFHVEMHHYLVQGKMHLANDRDPQIPEALAPVVGGVASLHDFFPVHQSILGKYVRRDKKTGRITPVDPEFSGLKFEYGFTNQEDDPQEDITPYDFATIYNLLPLWNAGITGKGQAIAISAVTDINASDVSTFRTTFGLSGFTGTIDQIHNGADPGVVQGALVENTLDTEWSGATAPDATVDVVVSASTATTFGGQLSDQYIAEHPSLFTIMSASYGQCEIGLGTAGNSAINAIYQQGAAAGISIFESAGDQGSTGCDNSDATTFPNPAQYGLQVNGDASSPYVTAVGGTEFTWQNFRTTYWSATNSTTNLSNALGYIPESPWNGTCTSQLLLDRFWQPNYSLTTLEQVCNYTAVNYDHFTTVTGGSGGVSSCITSTGGEFSSCGGGYAQPSWQKGVTGMPGSTYRYLPDVSLFASSGFPYGLNGSAYLICVASNSTDKTCDYTDDTQVIYQEVGGTSVSSPALAGIMALVQQKQGGVAQGLANPGFYALAAKDNLTNCNSSTVAAGNACNFYDVTYGNNAQVCTTGSRDCVTNTSGDTYGVVSGYPTTTGYDQATGLGSVNATNLVNNWASAVGSPAITLSPTSLTFASTTIGSTTAAQQVTVKNTGAAAATLTSETLTSTDASSYLISANTCGTSLAVNATCVVSVEFKPVATGTLTASLAVADNASGTPQTVTLTGAGAAASTFTVSLSPATLTFASTTEGSTTAAQLVTVKNTGTGTVMLTSETLTGTNPTDYLISAKTCSTSLAAGATCTVSIEFKPLAAGTLTAELSVADNATGTPQQVSLSGTGTAATAPALTLSTTSLTFASTAVGTTTAAQSVRLTNSGTAALTLNSETITGTDMSSFIKSATTCGSSLAVSASCTVSVEFDPAAPGTLTASLSIADNAAGTPQQVSLSGTGTAATAPALTLSATSISFASTAVGTTTAAQSVRLTNSGTATLTLTSETIQGTNSSSFIKSATTCGSSLAVSASCTVSVEFDPAAAGALTASLSIADNATGTPQQVSLSGTGSSSATLAVLTTPAPGTTLANGSVVFTWTAGTGVTNYQLWLGTNGVGSSGLYNSGSITAKSATVTIPANGSIVYARLYSEVGGVWKSNDYTYTETGTPAVLTAPKPNSTLTGTSVQFTWTAGAGVTNYQLWLGVNGIGSSGLYNSGSITATSATVTGIPAYGTTVYARLYSEIAGAWQYTDYSFTESGTPATMVTPTPSSTLAGPGVTFTWTAGEGVTHYQLWLGANGAGSSGLYDSGSVTTTSAAVTLPASGATIYARLYSETGGVWVYKDYTYVEAGTPAVMTSPAAGSTLGTSAVVFHWTAGVGNTEYQLWLGTSGAGSSSLYDSGSISATTTTVASIPATGATIYARLYSLSGGIWQYHDYTYIGK